MVTKPKEMVTKPKKQLNKKLEQLLIQKKIQEKR
jgi:hypothetical protein